MCIFFGIASQCHINYSFAAGRKKMQPDGGVRRHSWLLVSQSARGLHGVRKGQSTCQAMWRQLKSMYIGVYCGLKLYCVICSNGVSSNTRDSRYINYQVLY